MRGGEVLTRTPRSQLRARDRIAPATSSSRFELFGALSMSMRANDRAEHRYRSRSQLYTSSSGPRWMRGGEVLTRAPRSALGARAPRSAARDRSSRARTEFVTLRASYSFACRHARRS